MNTINMFYVCFILSYTFLTEAYLYTAELNTNKCKLTHSGIEYRGNVFTTKFKSLCRPWNSIGAELDSNLTTEFRMSAKNYCRNPNGARADLWCYTYNPDSPIESCAIPLCNSKKCRVTGPGAEYGGNRNVTKSGYACLSWSEVNDTAVKEDLKFPDGSRMVAKNRCRNPTGDQGGPWCYSTVDGTTMQDYCETSGCDDGVCSWTLVNGGRSSVHGHYSTLMIANNDFYVGFELKAWDPATTVMARKPFRISLTAYPIGSGQSGDGFEVSVPANVFARSIKVVQMDLSWRAGFVVLTTGRANEVLSFELNATISPVVYVSFVGGDRDVLFSVRFPKCDHTLGHEEHVTNSQNAYRIFPLKRTITSSSELTFSARALISVSVTYYIAPGKQTPRLVIHFAAKPTQQIKIIYKEKSTTREQLIFDQSYNTDIISYWKWHQYTITIVDKTLQIQIKNEYQKHPMIVLNITDYNLRFFHWFSIGSKGIAHWTLYCSGPQYYPMPKATLPNCVISKMSENYRGIQWISDLGEPCVPWNVSSVRKLVEGSMLIDGSYAKAKNYCRNPTKDPNGPYCYVAGRDGNVANVRKRSCRIRKCQNIRCSVTGIRTDFLGTLRKTVSNRTCLKWKTIQKTANIGRKYNMFPDGSSRSASNYCRNPTSDPMGAWCYVDDGSVTDLCDVPDCTGGDSETLLAGGIGVHWLYVLPEWRNAPGLRVAVKRWAPAVYEGVSLRFRSTCDPTSYDLLQVGADRNENVKLFQAQNGTEHGPATDNLVYPHIFMASRWTELRFELADGGDGRTAVTMSSVDNGQIFRWVVATNNGSCVGRIASVGLSTIEGRGYVGTRFPAEDCLVHSSESEHFSIYLPINVRTNTSLTNAERKIIFRIRHTGITRIALIKRTSSEFYVLEIEGDRVVLSREKESKKRMMKKLKTYETKTGEIIVAGVWKKLHLSWNESVLRLDHCCGTWQWTVERPLLVRYLSVANRGGRTTWTVNCDEQWRPLPDVDGSPIDGGWSEWSEWEQCTKTCGGGTGVRSRRCDRPNPNMSGRPCVGPNTAVGMCNEHECGQLSARTTAAIRRILASRSHNVVATVGDRLTMSCDWPTVNMVKIDSPHAKFSWLHNGKLMTHNDGCTLVINSCTTNDSGIYAFVTQPPETERFVLKLFAVSINGKPISVYIEDVISVRCNAVTLGYLFKGLSQKWVVNDSFVIKNYGVNSLATIDIDVITIENIHFQGIWKCIIESTEINNTWVTSAMEIKIIGVSTKWTRIMQDPIIKIIFHNRSPKIVVLISTILISSLCVGTWGCAYILNRFRTQLTKKDRKEIHKNIPYKHL